MSLDTTSAGPKGYGLGPVTEGDSRFPLRTRFDHIHRHNKDPVSLSFFLITLIFGLVCCSPGVVTTAAIGKPFPIPLAIVTEISIQMK